MASERYHRSDRTAAKATQAQTETHTTSATTPGRTTLTNGVAPLTTEQSLRQAIADASRIIDELSTGHDNRILTYELATTIDLVKRVMPQVEPALARSVMSAVRDLEARAAIFLDRIPAWSSGEDSRLISIFGGTCAPIASVADAELRLERAVGNEDDCIELAPVYEWLKALMLDHNLRERIGGGMLLQSALAMLGILAANVHDLVDRQRRRLPFKGMGPTTLRQFRGERPLLLALTGEAKDWEAAKSTKDAGIATLKVAALGVTAITAGLAAPAIFAEAQLVGWGIAQASRAALTLMLQNPVTTVTAGEWLADSIITIASAGGLAEYARQVGTDPHAFIGALIHVMHGPSAMFTGTVISANNKALVVRVQPQGAPEQAAPKAPTALNRRVSDFPALDELWGNAVTVQRSRRWDNDPREDFNRTRNRFVRELIKDSPLAVQCREVLESSGFRFLTNEKTGRLKPALPLLHVPGLELHINPNTIDMFRMSFQHLDMLQFGGDPVATTNLMITTGRDNIHMDTQSATVRAKTVDQVRQKK